jgi:hypothetical protein
MERPFLDASEITRDRTRWMPIGRGDAVRLSRGLPIAVVHRIQSREAAAWLDGDSRFFKSDGPYFHDGLRYFLYMGAVGGRKLIGLRPPPKPEPEAPEPMEALDMSGEALNLGSPAKKPKPKLPIESQLADSAGKALANADYEVILPDAARDAIAGSLDSGLPEPPGLLGLPDLPKLPRPVEILLTDESDLPLRHAPYRVEFPDGKVHTGESDAAGFIRFPENTQEGELLLVLTGPREKATA